MKLEIANICKDFTTTSGKLLPVLQDINLSINKEEFVALVGRPAVVNQPCSNNRRAFGTHKR